MFAGKNAGTFFGELDFLREGDKGQLEARRTFTIKAKSLCIAMFLPKSALLQIGPEFRAAVSELFALAEEERKKLLEMRDKAVSWFYKKGGTLGSMKKYPTKEDEENVKISEGRYKMLQEIPTTNRVGSAISGLKEGAKEEEGVVEMLREVLAEVKELRLEVQELRREREEDLGETEEGARGRLH